MIERRGQSRRLESRRALYSPCGRYRYLLEIVFLAKQGDASRLQVIGLNPSTATEFVDDPTLRRCKWLAQHEGYGGLLMTNLAAFRSTSPQVMLWADDPIGRENTPEFLASLPATEVLAAWGAHGSRKELAAQVDAVRTVFGHRLCALRRTKNGQPAHPLYLPNGLRPVPLEELSA